MSFFCAVTEPRVVARQPLLEAEGLRIDGPQLRMIAAASLRYVVKERGQIGELGLGQRRHQPRQLRKLVLEARQREAAQVTHHEQRVRIDRVGMEQVVLHPADDAAEGWDIAAEHAVQV